jgi:hypothetical protein
LISDTPDGNCQGCRKVLFPTLEGMLQCSTTSS